MQKTLAIIIYFVYSSVHILIPNPNLFLPSLLLDNNKYVFYVYESMKYKKTTGIKDKKKLELKRH